jgi:hypothetical protein
VVPLLVAYFVLAVLYAWQAWRREVPTIFTDELEMSQISRAIAETGWPARRGESYMFTTLVPWLTAPAWWIADTETAFATIKYLQTLVMAAAIFPAYLLARTVVSHPWAVFAAVATIAAPALSYAPILVEEPFAYPAATLAFWLLVRMAIRPTWRSVALAVGGCLLATLIRSQLIALVPVLLVPLIVHGWRSEAMRRHRATWSRWDWAGAVALGVGAVLFVMAVIGHRSADWAEMMALWKERIVEYGLWAAGGFAIGVGVLPLIAALAVLARPRAELREPAIRAYVLVSGSALFFLGFYAGLKGGYISTKLGSYVVERNLIYLAPIAFASTALLLERRNPRWWAVGGATAFVLYLVIDVPLRIDQYPYYEAHGLAIAALANRIPAWPAETIEHVLVVVALASGLALAGLTLTRWRRAIVATGAVLAVFTLAWSLTTEIYAANGERRASDQAYAALPKPADWVDQMTGREGTLFVGQGISDPNAFWQLEFWNPSIRWLWGIDGSTPGGVTPNLLRPDGTLGPSYPGAEYVVASKGLSLAAPEVTTVGDYVVYRLRGQPVRLTQASSGIDGDGWMHERATYTRYAAEQDPKGFVLVRLSREASCYPQLKPVHVSARVGPVVVSDSDQPVIGKVTATREGELVACKATGLLLPVPDGPWHVEATVSDTFVPRELDSNSPDTRALGAKVSFELVPLDSE